MPADNKPYRFIDYFRSILSILVFFLLLVLFTPVILVILIISFGRLSNFVIEKIAPVIALAVLKVIGIKFVIRNHAETIPSPAVFIINHSSTLDVLTLLALGLPRVRFVAKWEFQFNPIFLILGRLTGQVFIRREKSEKAVETLQKNVNRIKEQRLSLMMAPEGTRKHPGIIGPFKKGPFRMALDLDYPIVPIYFEGNYDLCSGDYLVARSGTCIAHIHPAHDTSGWKLETLEKQITKIRKNYLIWAGILQKTD